MSEYSLIVQTTLSKITLWAALYVIIGILGYIIYQVIFHPYAKYPGPVLAKLSGLRAAYHAWKGDIHLDLWRCHQKYGPVVRYSPTHVSINTTGALKDVYGMGKNVTKDKIYWKSHLTSNLLTLVDRKEHANRRRLIGSEFSDQAMRKFEPRLVDHAKEACLALDSTATRDQPPSWSQPLKMSDWCNNLTFDVMAEFLYNRSLDLVSSPTYRDLPKYVDQFQLRQSVLLYCPLLYIGRMDRKLFRNSALGHKKFRMFLGDLIKESEVPGNKELGIYTKLRAAATGPSPQLTLAEAESELFMLSIAGYDTTSTALAAVLFYLAKCPHAYARLAEEVRGTFSCLDDIKTDDSLRNCRYLEACVNEGLRMSPPIPSSMWRQALSGGIMVDGHFIPEGLSVGTGIYSIHHSADYFHRPHEFLPERWLAEDDQFGTQDELKESTAAFNPFLFGPRSCPGQPLARAELLVTTATMIWLYDFRIPQGSEGQMGAGDAFRARGRTNPGEFQLYDRMTTWKEGPMLQLRRRQV